MKASLLHWDGSTENLSTDSIHSAIVSVLANQAGALIIHSFFSPSHCKELVTKCVGAPKTAYDGMWPPITKIGVAQIEFGLGYEKEHGRGRTAEMAYLRRAAKAHVGYKELFGELLDPVSAVVRFLSSIFAVDFARDPREAPYFAGIIHGIKADVPLHFDDARVVADGWSIAKVKNQASWNIVLREAKGGHSTIVYRRYWRPSYDHLEKDGYGYPHSVVKGAPSVKVQGKLGDLFFFNTRNFHEVKALQPSKVSTPRVTAMSFIGQLEKKKLILWS